MQAIQEVKMEQSQNFRKVLIVLMLVFSLLFITACDYTKAGGEKKEEKQTDETSKANESDSTKKTNEGENKALTDDKSTAGLTDHPMVIKAEGALRLDLGRSSLPNKDYRVDYIDYDSFFENPSVDLSDERYADITKDGKVDWTIAEEREFAETPVVLELMEKITLDGKKVTLPMKFVDLGEEYAIFDKADFSWVTGDMHPFQIVDVKTNNKLISSSKGIYFNTKYLEILDDKDTLILTIGVNLEINAITYIYSNDLDIMSKKSLFVDGIGIGNTLNEVYDHFGHPMNIRNKDKYVPSIRFSSGKYSILLICKNNMYNPILRKEDKIIRNIVTGIGVWCN